MSTHPPPTPPDATSATPGDEAALRALLRRRSALFPALRREDCPPGTLGEYLTVCGGIMFIQSRIGVARYRAIKAESDRERPAPAATAPGEGATRC